MIAMFRILFLLLVISTPSWGETMDDLDYRGFVLYEKFSDVPFTGEVEGKTKGSVKNGHWDGDFSEYWENGQLRSKGNYKDGKREGSWTEYWYYGELSEKGTYQNGRLEGPWFRYYENGQVMWIGNYKNGQLNGDFLGYTVDGFVDKNYTATYKNGVKVND